MGVSLSVTSDGSSEFSCRVVERVGVDVKISLVEISELRVGERQGIFDRS